MIAELSIRDQIPQIELALCDDTQLDHPPSKTIVNQRPSTPARICTESSSLALYPIQRPPNGDPAHPRSARQPNPPLAHGLHASMPDPIAPTDFLQINASVNEQMIDMAAIQPHEHVFEGFSD